MVSPFLLPPELIPLPGTAPGKDVAQMLHLVSLIYTSVTEGGSVVEKKKKENQPAVQETRVGYLVQEDPLEKEMATQSSILA